MTPFNPFPGLRPFEPDEDHLFFGREKEIDELLRRLRSTRFLSVIGTSGSGKSSLVRSGLIPSLYSGFMVTAGSSWRVAILRPGDDPIGHLAQALDQFALGTVHSELRGADHLLVEATLRRGTLGLVDAVRHAKIPASDNILVVVDQFEELFRFRRNRLATNSRDEAILFVKLLLEAIRQTVVPIYVVLTMRSDFIGDCMAYPGLPDAVNNGQYLVPRMTRDQVRSAITGPVAVGGGEIAPRLVRQLLNELGDDQDQLPVLQHALMRTWDAWERHHQPGEPIDMAAYEAIGALRGALSLHAEEAYEDAGKTGGTLRQHIVEGMFKALTDTFSDQRGVRRPTSVRDLAGICETSEAEVIEIVEIFRRPGRSFLMPPSVERLGASSIIDLSHESLMRGWTRLVEWTEQDRLSASFYVRVSQAAAWFAEGSAGLWRNPELELGLRWTRDNRPTPAWTRRFDESFDRVMAFLDRSEQARSLAKAAQERERMRTLRQAQWAAVVFGVLFVVAAGLAYVARQENLRAATNLRLAKEAVDETLSSAGLDPASAGADVPQMAEFRRQLLEKAKVFYVAFLKQDASSEVLRHETALAHLRLGHIDRWLENADAAAREYGQAIGIFEGLKKGSPKAEYRQGQANSYNWLGLTLTGLTSRVPDAERAYNTAFTLQEDLVRASPSRPDYQQELARTRYNRGILHALAAVPGQPDYRVAESEFREAISLLEPLTRSPSDRTPSLELARTYNNLAMLLALDDQRLGEAKGLYEAAIRHDEALTRAEPVNREYQLELAKYYNNLSDLHRHLDEADLAKARSRQALDLLDQLASPAPSLAIEQADAHTVRGHLLQAANPRGAVAEYQQAVTLFEKLRRDRNGSHLPAFHQRYQDLLQNLAAFARDSRNAALHALLLRSISGYLDFANASLAAGSTSDAQLVLDHITNLLPELSELDQLPMMTAYRALQQTLAARR